MKIILTSVIATMIAGSAFAGSLDYTAAEPAPVAPQTFDDVSWTGSYMGLQYSNGDFDVSDGENSGNVDVDGFGLHAGYLYDMCSVIVGGEFSYDRISADEDGADGDVDLARLRGRVGYDLGKFQPYITLGVAHLSDDEFSETGLTYGIGAEYLVSNQFSVGVEYSRSQFNDIDNQDGVDGDLDLIQLRGSDRF